MGSFTLILHIFRDLVLRFLPIKVVKRLIRTADFAFLVHPRDYRDTARKYKFARKLSPGLLNWILLHLWPLIVAPITGLKDRNGKEKFGYVIACPMPAAAMLNNRKLALKRIIQGIKLAEKTGAKIVGLGALTASLSKGGKDIAGQTNLKITSGYLYTTLTVTQHTIRAARDLNLSLDRAKVAVVGAAGNVGSNVVRALAREGVKEFLLVDLIHKRTIVKQLQEELARKFRSHIRTEYTPSLNKIYGYDIIVTATSAPDALVRTEHVAPSTVILDDAQPSDVDEKILCKRDDVLVISAGVVHTPKIIAHFNFGLANKDDNFSCLAEVLILSYLGWHENFGIDRLNDDATLTMLRNAERELNFQIGGYQNECRVYSPEYIEKIKKIRKKNAS